MSLPHDFLHNEIKKNMIDIYSARD
jgi:hypothetical protein